MNSMEDHRKKVHKGYAELAAAVEPSSGST